MWLQAVGCYCARAREGEIKNCACSKNRHFSIYIYIYFMEGFGWEDALALCCCFVTALTNNIFSSIAQTVPFAMYYDWMSAINFNKLLIFSCVLWFQLCAWYEGVRQKWWRSLEFVWIHLQLGAVEPSWWTCKKNIFALLLSVSKSQ